MSLEITSVKLGHSHPNVGQSQVVDDSVSLKSSESEVVEATTVPDELNSIIDVKDRLQLQSEFLNKVSLSVTAQEHQEALLRRLREKINTKKKEFELLVQNPEGTEEERMDLLRALHRMERLYSNPLK